MRKTVTRYILAATGTLCVAALLCWHVVLPALLNSKLTQLVNEAQDTLVLRSAHIEYISLTQASITNITANLTNQPAVGPIAIRQITASYSPAQLLRGAVRRIQIDGIALTVDAHAYKTTSVSEGNQPHQPAQAKRPEWTEQEARPARPRNKTNQALPANWQAMLPPVKEIAVHDSVLTIHDGAHTIPVPFTAEYSIDDSSNPKITGTLTANPINCSIATTVTLQNQTAPSLNTSSGSPGQGIASSNQTTTSSDQTTASILATVDGLALQQLQKILPATLPDGLYGMLSGTLDTQLTLQPLLDTGPKTLQTAITQSLRTLNTHITLRDVRRIPPGGPLVHIPEITTKITRQQATKFAVTLGTPVIHINGEALAAELSGTLQADAQPSLQARYTLSRLTQQTPAVSVGNATSSGPKQRAIQNLVQSAGQEAVQGTVHATANPATKSWTASTKGSLAGMLHGIPSLSDGFPLSGITYSLSASSVPDNAAPNEETAGSAPALLHAAVPGSIQADWQISVPAPQLTHNDITISSNALTAQGSLRGTLAAASPVASDNAASVQMQEPPQTARVKQPFEVAPPQQTTQHLSGPFTITMPRIRIKQSGKKGSVRAGGDFTMQGTAALLPYPAIALTLRGKRLFATTPEARIRQGAFKLPLNYRLPHNIMAVSKGSIHHKQDSSAQSATQKLNVATKSNKTPATQSTARLFSGKPPSGWLRIPHIQAKLPQTGKSGYIPVGSMRLKLQQDNTTSTIQNNAIKQQRLRWNGTFACSLLPKLNARIQGAFTIPDPIQPVPKRSGHGQPASPKHTAASNALSAAPRIETTATITDYVLPADVNLTSLAAQLNNIAASGTISAATNVTYTLGKENGLDATAQVVLQNGTVTDTARGVTLKGLSASILFPQLPVLRTLPLQRATFSELLYKDVKLSNGEILFMLAAAEKAPLLKPTETESAQQITGKQSSPNKPILPEGQIAPNKQIIVESIRFNWLGGQIVSLPFQIVPEKTEYDVTLFCSNLNIAQLLSQLGFAQAKGEGEISGKIPVAYRNGKITFNNAQLQSSPESGGSIMIPQAESLLEGVPEGSPQYVQMKIASEALKDFEYKWAKVTATSTDDNLKLQLQLDGNPARNLPFEYSNDLGMLKLQTTGPGMKFQGVRLDVNFNLPLDRMLRLKELFGQGE